MGTPLNDFRLPTKEEVSHTKASIIALEADANSLRTTLTNNQRRADAITSELARLQDELKNIHTQNNDVSKRMDAIDTDVLRRRAWISPQRTLPKEMLGEIFIAHVRLDWKAPLIDASVCKRWRSTALSTPRLWSFLRIPDPDVPQELTSLWLKRAGNAPLHVHISYVDVTPEHLEQYRDVYCMKFKPWPTNLHGLSYSKLEKLILDHDDASMDHLARDVFTTFGRLRILHLHWFRLSRRPLLQWAWDLPPLEEFHIAGASWVWIDAVELIASSVKRLAIDMGDVAPPPPPSIPVRTIHLPQLTYFAYGAQSRTLMVNDAARLPIVSRILQAPNVEVFEDHTVIPLETSIPPEDNWNFPRLKTYLGRTSRELAEVKTLYPHVESITFVVDSETGVLDVASLIDSATEGELDQLREVDMYLGAPLSGHPMIKQSLRKYVTAKGKALKMNYHSGRDETPHQKCYFGFPCCGTYDAMKACAE
ncbi:hypothetical protein M408DRAFT_24764 [Serendipita vermifera MAFF 305830]|uniref:Uncharacterized protein n=1 Tax=Serendipita vermifera MAFF 305830 TaxID=933852 RepID=A0A0C3ARU9_SERVB|nr:hypothetical protein M408DRAFT_24764 [Serendipita vermifera MAFF 305830]